MPVHNYYEVLELSPECSTEDIKERYRKLAKRFHPDKSSTISENQVDPSKFILINEAYRILSSPDIRQEYDRCRRDAEKSHLIYAEVDVCEMDSLEDVGSLSYPCRCGDSYNLSQERLKNIRTPQFLVPCSSCSFVLLVNMDNEQPRS